VFVGVGAKLFFFSLGGDIIGFVCLWDAGGRGGGGYVRGCVVWCGFCRWGFFFLGALAPCRTPLGTLQ